MMRSLFFMFILGCLIGVPQYGVAEEVPRTLSYLCERSEEIVEATVESFEVIKHTDGRDYTWIKFAVQQTYKGNAAKGESLVSIFVGKPLEDGNVFHTATGIPFLKGQKSLYLFDKTILDDFGTVYYASAQSKFDFDSQMPDIVTRNSYVPLYLDSFDVELPQTCKLSSPVGSGRMHYDYYQVVSNIKHLVKKQAANETGAK